MFNKNDYFLGETRQIFRQELIKKMESVKDPKDYFQGLPSNPVIIPENILVFFRRKTIEKSGPAIHHRFVLICNFGGAGSVVIDNKVYRVKVGEAVLIYPHQFHIYTDFESENISWIFVTFEVENQGILASKENVVFPLSDYATVSLSLLIDVYKSTTQDGQKTGANGRLLLASILTDMSSHLSLQSKSNHEESLSSPMQLVQTIVEFIYQNLNEPIQINDVAKHVHFSPSHLRVLFRKNMRIGLGSYIRRARIHRACFLIRSTEMTFSQVTTQCGFTSLYSFSRAFRQETKMSPTEYKSQYTK